MRKWLRKGYALGILAVFLAVVFCFAGMATAATKNPVTGRYVFTDAETAYPKFVGNQNQADAAYGAYMADLKVKTAVAAQVAADAMTAQDKWLNLISYIPPIGVTMAWYNSGEMDYVAEDIMALRAGKPAPWGNASTRGVLNVLFKVPAGAPEAMFAYGVNRPFASRWNELDVFNVYTEYGRPYWVDGVIIGTKVFFGLAGAGVLHTGFPFVGHYAAHHSSHVVLPVLGYTGPVGNAFLWMAAAGGTANILAGAGNQYVQPSYDRYFSRLAWANSRNPL
ncbi:MAG: hypothetical protein Q8L09_03460 [Candidatus Moranbacteria bacterium]|nr:hypothetical protein [Candidatus Moranbacteria bacterium]